jgi:CubicO group peptidase (beta-lactamase class C family)
VVSKLLRFIVRVVICFLPLAASAQGRPPRLSDAEVVRRVNAYLAPLGDHELSGTLLVARGNRILVQRSFGFANYELGVRFTPTTPTNVASITKPLTDIIAARLSDEKRLSWDDTVSKWLPNYVYGARMTVTQLINHRAGVPHRLLPDSEQAMPRTAQEMVEIANRVPLLFQPGDSESYSSGGYAIWRRCSSARETKRTTSCSNITWRLQCLRRPFDTSIVGRFFPGERPVRFRSAVE